MRQAVKQAGSGGLKGAMRRMGRDCGETPLTFKRHVTFRVYLLHPEVRSMSKAFRMYLLHPDDDLSCSGLSPTRTGP